MIYLPHETPQLSFASHRFVGALRCHIGREWGRADLDVANRRTETF